MSNFCLIFLSILFPLVLPISGVSLDACRAPFQLDGINFDLSGLILKEYVFSKPNSDGRIQEREGTERHLRALKTQTTAP
jgi:hypothetical protein